jgi:hypothetical protein
MNFELSARSYELFEPSGLGTKKRPVISNRPSDLFLIGKDYFKDK